MTIPIGTLCLIVMPSAGRWKDENRVEGKTCVVTGTPEFLSGEKRFRYYPVEPFEVRFVAEPCLVPIAPPRNDLAIERLTTLPATC
jgi:hypothetical protein